MKAPEKFKERTYWHRQEN